MRENSKAMNDKSKDKRKHKDYSKARERKRAYE